MLEIISGCLVAAFFVFVIFLWVTFLLIYQSSREFERVVDQYITVSSGADAVGSIIILIYATASIGTAFNTWLGGLLCVLFFILAVSVVVGSLFAARYLARFFEDRK